MSSATKVATVFDQPSGAPEEIARTPLVVAPGYPTKFRRIRAQHSTIPGYFLAGAVMLDEIHNRDHSDGDIVTIARNLVSMDRALRRRVGVPVVIFGYGHVLAGRSVPNRGLYLTRSEQCEPGELRAHIPLGGVLDVRFRHGAIDPEMEVRHARPAQEVTVEDFFITSKLLSPRNLRSAGKVSQNFTEVGALIVGERGVPAFFTEATSEARAAGDASRRREHAVASRAAEVLGAHGFPVPRVKVLA